MNEVRRKELQKALDLISEAKEIIQGVKQDEEQAFDNMPESLQEGEKGEKMQSAIEKLDGCYDACENIESDLNEAME